MLKSVLSAISHAQALAVKKPHKYFIKTVVRFLKFVIDLIMVFSSLLRQKNKSLLHEINLPIKFFLLTL